MRIFRWQLEGEDIWVAVLGLAGEDIWADENMWVTVLGLAAEDIWRVAIFG